MAASARLRVGIIALLACLVAALGAILLGGSQSDAATGYKPPRVDQSRLILRLTDLPPGYVNGYLGEGRGGDGIFCQPFTRSQDELPALGALVRAYRLEGCLGAFERAYTLPGEEARAAVVFTGVTALGSRTATDAFWSLVPSLLGLTTKGRQKPAKRPAPVKVGAASRLFRTSAVPANYARSGRKASFLVWRSGNVVAIVAAISKTFAETDATVAELAPRQQAHIAKPTPYTGAERDDAEVALDDPALNLPVYWLGRPFRPGGGLPKSKLVGSYFPGKALPEREVDDYRATFTLGPSAPLQINYESIDLATWSSSNWHLFANSEAARDITSWNCTKTRTVALPEGSATIFGGYRRDFAKCPPGPPQAFTAWVDVGGVKVVVNAPFLPGFIDVWNPYASFEDMEAIVRGLKLRPKPVY